MVINYEQSPEAIIAGIKPPAKAHDTDSGFDIFSPVTLFLMPNERCTVNLQVRFAIPTDFAMCGIYPIGIEGQIRPKSGRSRAGIDVELGTIDAEYRGYVGATITNTTLDIVKIEANEKLCQLVFAPVIREIVLEAGKVATDTERGEKGFGATGLK